MEHTKEQRAQYRLNNREKVRALDKKHHAKYVLNNLEKIKEMRKRYRANNAEKINQKIMCECGSVVAKKGIIRHRLTSKHLKLLEK